MGVFFLCFLQIVLYTLGVIVVCGLTVEVCYRLCFVLMGRRAGRLFWFATSWLGTPVHEAGHALMCFLFGHRIEKMRLVPSRAGGAMVEHSYNNRNVYATLGNLFIAIGPVFTGLGVILLTLHIVYPESLQAYFVSLEALLAGSASERDIFAGIWRFIQGLGSEGTRALWARILAGIVLFSMALHVRLSTADVRGMLRGLPNYLVICALVAGVIALMGGEAPARAAIVLRQFAWIVVALFSLILVFAVIQLTIVLIYRVFAYLIVGPSCEKVDLSRYKDYRDRDWDEFKQ
jgi:hypothetical protein